jgi:hypothetical protein
MERSPPQPKRNKHNAIQSLLMNQNIDQSFEWIGSEVRQMQRTSSHPNLNSKEGGLRVWEGDGQHSLLQPTKSVVVERVQPVSRAPTQSATVEQAHGESQESMQPNRCWGSPTCSSRHHTTSAASSKFTGCCRGKAVNSSLTPPPMQHSLSNC